MITKEQAIQQGFEYSTSDVCAMCNVSVTRLRQMRNGRTDKRKDGSAKYVELAILEKDRDYVHAIDKLRTVTMYSYSALAKLQERIKNNVYS